MDGNCCDPLRPEPDVSYLVRNRSESIWRALLCSAESATHLPHSCSNIKALLHRAPSIPQSREVSEVPEERSLYMEGHARWDVPVGNESPSHICELGPVKNTLSRKVYIGESTPTSCKLSNIDFFKWAGFQPKSKTDTNYLSVFVLGWSYVLSARLVELRQMNIADRIVYTENMAPLIESDDSASEDSDVELSYGRIMEVRWWAAVLADGHGWKACLSRGGRDYFPPWECHLVDSPFRIRHFGKVPLLSATSLEPPSSVEAHKYLLNFARAHNAFDQLLCAFAATITLPMHNRFGASVSLPKPTSRGLSHQYTEQSFADQIPTFTEIPYYMAFSATSGLLASCLFGSFWEPNIPCNLASQWLNPAMEEIQSTLQSKQSFPIIWAMSERRPNVASLWLGAAVTGLLPRILQVSRSFLPATYLEAVTWTSSPQSFMDPPNYRSIRTQRVNNRHTISREEEFRLLFLTDTLSETYGNPPLCPYRPFGRVDIQDTALQVRLHLHCNHRLIYLSWEWLGQHGKLFRDTGFPYAPKPCKIPFRTNSLSLIWMTTGVTLAFLLHKPVPTATFTQLQLIGIVLPFSFTLICLVPRPIKIAVYKQLRVILAWAKGSSTGTSMMIRPNFRHPREERIPDERLSMLATRNLFSWTLFTEGTRIEERPLWKHEWLNNLVNREMDAISSESSPSEFEGEVDCQKMEYIRSWQEDVSMKLN